MKKVLFLFLILFCCGIVTSEAETKGKKEVAVMVIELKSPALKEGGFIEKKYTCDGENVSLPLSWENIPAETKSLALICDDPDAPAGDWVHWVLFNIPAEESSLPEAVSRDKILKNGAMQGLNGFRKIGYDGPCPPGGVHRYYFKIFALDRKLNLEPGASKAELLHAMEGHIVASGKLMGRYKR